MKLLSRSEEIVLLAVWRLQGNAYGVSIREQASRAEIGIVLNLTPSYAVSSRPADEDAARQFDGFFNRWYLDPLFRGRYPEDVVADHVRRGHLDGRELPFVELREPGRRRDRRRRRRRRGAAWRVARPPETTRCGRPGHRRPPGSRD